MNRNLTSVGGRSSHGNSMNVLPLRLIGRGHYSACSALRSIS